MRRNDWYAQQPALISGIQASFEASHRAGVIGTTVADTAQADAGIALGIAIGDHQQFIDLWAQRRCHGLDQGAALPWQPGFVVTAHAPRTTTGENDRSNARMRDHRLT